MMAGITRLNGYILTPERIRGFRRGVKSISVDATWATVNFTHGNSCQYKITKPERLLEWAWLNGYDASPTSEYARARLDAEQRKELEQLEMRF